MASGHQGDRSGDPGPGGTGPRASPSPSEPSPARLALPNSPLAEAVLAEVVSAETAPVAHHSIRSFLFARLLADRLGATGDSAYDEELLFAACALHDLGLATSTGGTHRFEIEGADRAARLLTSQGLAAHRVDAVWEAIALHTSFQIAERRGLLVRLTRGGVGMDFGYEADFVTDEQAEAIHAGYPRLDLERNLVDVIVGQAAQEPNRAPRYSMTAVLVAQRAVPPHLSQIETAAAASRWAAVP